MGRLLLDTDVLIDHLEGVRSLPVARHDVAYSAVSRAELYSGPEADEPSIDDLLSRFLEVPVTRQVAEAAGRVRRETRIKLPDALIAATALLTRRRLLTRNARDFARVTGLRLHSGG